MADDTLANTVVRTLSEYLAHKKNTGLFEGRLENLRGQVEAKMSDPYATETFARFADKPDGNLEVNQFRHQLIEAIAADPEFARQLALTLGGKMARSARRGKWRTAAAGVVAVAAIGGVYVLGRATSPDTSNEATPPMTVTSTVEHTVEVTESTTEPSTTEPTSTDPSAATGQGIPGDGSTYPKGQPVPLATLPRPNDQWLFENGSHDVQFKQYNNSVWHELNTCNQSSYSLEQQFRLTNFSRLEVKALGTDSQADPGLVVKFDVFANNDSIKPIASIVADPGATKQLAVDLPANVFTLTLRMSLTKTGEPCQRGNAVWGEPYVIAAGN
jgi:hypothetical protein